MDLVYDLEGNFLHSSSEILSEDLPITILAVINQTYPGFIITDPAYELDYGNKVEYEVLLGGIGDGLELVITPDGTVIFEGENN